MASQVFSDGRIFTGRGEDDFVTAFRVTDGVIDWVGDRSEIDTTDAHSLGGRTVVPGLLDMHLHPALMSQTIDAVDCLPPAVSSLRELVDVLGATGAGTPDAWIIGNGYDDTKYPEGRPPDRRDLDAVSTTRPVLVWRCDRHSAVCNTRALEIAGITALTPDPPGARFERDAGGRPTGVLTEIAAAQAVASHVPEPAEDERMRSLRRVGDRLLSRGIVGVCDLLASRIADPLATYRAAGADGRMPRAALFLGWDRADPPADLLPADRAGRSRIGGLKVIMDGAYSNRTAWVTNPYPASVDDHGLRTLDDVSAIAAADWAERNGVQLAVHAMGDGAIEQVLALFSDREPWLADAPSIRIEHATLLRPTTIERLRTARMRFGVATHTVFLFAEYDGYARNLRPELRDHAYPVRSLYGAIPALALSSDCPATAWSDADDPFVSIEAAVRRRAYNGADIGQEQSVSVAQALLLYTARAASVSRLGPVGSIDVGREASFAVLDQDVFTVAPDRIGGTAVDETWIAGERVWAR